MTVEDAAARSPAERSKTRRSSIFSIDASRSPSRVEIVEDGRTGLPTEPGDAGALATAIRRLVGNAALAARVACDVKAVYDKMLA